MKVNQQKLPKLINREEKRLRMNEYNLSDLWANIKSTNIHVMVISERGNNGQKQTNKQPKLNKTQAQ